MQDMYGYVVISVVKTLLLQFSAYRDFVHFDFLTFVVVLRLRFCHHGHRQVFVGDSVMAAGRISK